MFSHPITFYTANSYHSTHLIWYQGLGVSRFAAFCLVKQNIYLLKIKKIPQIVILPALRTELNKLNDKSWQCKSNWVTLEKLILVLLMQYCSMGHLFFQTFQIWYQILNPTSGFWDIGQNKCKRLGDFWEIKQFWGTSFV